MGIIDRFEHFAEDFEAAVKDDNWGRLEKYFAEDATYRNVGGPDPKRIGRSAIIEFLRNDVTNWDRKFDSRELTALSAPTAEGNHLTRQWRCRYRVKGTPDLVVEGEARYVFDGDLIKQLEEEVTAESKQKLKDWMKLYGQRLGDQS